MNNSYIPYEDLGRLNAPYEEEYMHSLRNTLRSGWFISGSTCELFEKNFAAYCGTDYCIGVNSGLDALTIALSCFEFKTGSEVIVPGLTYFASVLAIIHAGLKPVMAEPDTATCNLTAESVARHINANTVAIMPVHMYGRCCNMDGIMELAQIHGLKVVEDCAQAHGALYKGKKAGNLGHIAAFSFYPTKNLGALGDGGAITTSDPQLAHKAKAFRNYGSSEKYNYRYRGYNSRLDDIQAGFLDIKLRRLDAINEHKIMLANAYLKLISPRQATLPAITSSDYKHVYHIFNIRHPERNRLREYLHQKGIGTEIHYPVPPHHQQALAEYFPGISLPVTENMHRQTLSLPISTIHSTDDIEIIADAINQFK